MINVVFTILARESAEISEESERIRRFSGTDTLHGRSPRRLRTPLGAAFPPASIPTGDVHMQVRWKSWKVAVESRRAASVALQCGTEAGSQESDTQCSGISSKILIRVLDSVPIVCQNTNLPPAVLSTLFAFLIDHIFKRFFIYLVRFFSEDGW